MTLDDAVTEVLTRLGDKENQIWSRDEIKLYFKDGLDQFCHRTKCLWDVYIIENLPPVGNWQTDLEKHLAEQIPGMQLTDERMHFTAEDERSKSTGGYSGAYPGTRSGPAVATGSADRDQLDSFTNITVSAGKQVTGGNIPNDTVEVTRVAYDQRTLTGISSQRMREIDPRYETRGGEPQWFMFDKDGLFYIRVVPAAQGSASYDTVSGSYGTCTYRGTAEYLFFTANELFNLTMNGNTITDGGYSQGGSPSSWSSGGISNETVISGDGYVECVAQDSGSKQFYFGMTSGSYDVTVPALMDLGWYADATDRVRPYVEGSAKGSSIYIGSDYPITLRIEIDSDNGNVLWKVNGVTKYTRSYTPTYPMRCVFSLYEISDDGVNLLEDIVISPTGESEVTDTIADDNTGGYGILRSRSDCFPSGGIHGTPTRIHPDAMNIKVDVFRQNRDLDSYEVEIPLAYQKYPIFWAMHKALEKTGQGQDIQLSDHYKGRFELGTTRMEAKVREMDKERAGRLGGLIKMRPFGLGDPVPPYPYGVPF